MNKFIVTLMIAVLLPAVSYALPPVIFFSDIVSGPSTGGKDDKGAFVTIIGRNFGQRQATSRVAVGGGAADNYPVWTDTRITFQLGKAASSGPIVVTTADGDSNGIPFKVRAGTIYFVSAAAASVGSGAYGDPWHNGSSFFAAMRPGDIAYFRAGVYREKMGASSGRGNISITGPAPDGAANSEIAWLAYPGEVVRLETGQGDIRSNIEIDKGYYVIAGFQMYSDGSCIEYGGNNNRIVNNTCEGLKRLAYGNVHTNGGSGNKLYGNELFGARSGNKLDHAIYVAYGPRDFDIGWNYIHDNDISVGPAISVHTDGAENSNTIFRNISIHDNTVDCRRSSSALRALGIVETAKGSSVYVYNNVFIEPGSDVSYYNGIYQYSASAYFYNNTFFNCKGPAALLAGRSNTYAPETVDIRNNIFYVQQGCEYVRINDAASIGRVTVSNNCYYGNGPGPTTDTHAVNADPLFVDPWNADDFRLRENSPCIDAGDSGVASVVGAGRDGMPRPRGKAFDIGAYEFAGVTDASASRNGISGYLKDPGGAGIGGVRIYLSGDVSGTTVTDASGFYHFPGLASGGRYTVKPSTETLAFSPERRSTASLSAAGEWNFQLAFSSSAVTIPLDQVRVVGSAGGRGTVNPDRGESAKIYFKGAQRGKFECRIFSLAGDLIWIESKDDVMEGIFEWAPGGTASGAYVVNVTGPGINTTKKIAVVR